MLHPCAGLWQHMALPGLLLGAGLAGLIVLGSLALWFYLTTSNS